jgi:secreted trypsin-like serine protease
MIDNPAGGARQVNKSQEHFDFHESHSCLIEKKQIWPLGVKSHNIDTLYRSEARIMFVRKTFLMLISLAACVGARLGGNGTFYTIQDLRLCHEHEVAESRIVGGTAASRGEYLYFVSWAGCAASLIAPNLLLSAAHCAGISSNRVVVGAYQKWWGQTSGDAESRTIGKRYVHPAYSSTTYANDYMVLELTEPITHIAPVKLNFEAALPEVGQTLTAIGFGAVFEGGWGSRLLQEVEVNYVSPDQCNKEYDGDIVEEVMLCAGVEAGGKDSVSGD